ncbi:hypothetical protein ACN47E_002340 [Coniothyrium glycines]
MIDQESLQSDGFNILEASIEDHRHALASGRITCIDLIVSYLNRIATYDTCSGLNAFTVLNQNVLEEAEAIDTRHTQHLAPRPLEGIPYTIKDSYKVAGLTVTNGSPALDGLMSSEDSAIASKLREAGAILLGKTNMPPMAAGGMQRGMYGRAESPYNSKYLTGAFSSGSSNGAATSIAASMAVFGMGSETVSSGRSPASNNALVCYTPSKGVLSCRGLWPLYITCDVPTPMARSVDDMLHVLNVIATREQNNKGDFIREQKFAKIPDTQTIDYTSLRRVDALAGKRIGVPNMYVGGNDSNPHAKCPFVSEEVKILWEQTAKELEDQGATIVYTDFPLVTNYEDDSASGEANNVDGRPANWNLLERGDLIAMAWNEFLLQNGDKSLKSLKDIEDCRMIFPKPEGYLPDEFLEIRNWIDYPGLPALLDKISAKSIHEVQGMEQALKALEAQRRRDLEDWMDTNGLDVIAFPAQGDVGFADLEFNLESTTHSLQNGIKYSNGNRAIRHLGVPTVSVPMGVMREKKMPVNLTFAGKAYEDSALLEYAYAFELATNKRITPPLTPSLPTDIVRFVQRSQGDQHDHHTMNLLAEVRTTKTVDGSYQIHISGTISSAFPNTRLQVFVDGSEAYSREISNDEWQIILEHAPRRSESLGWNLKPLPPRGIMIIVVARAGPKVQAKLLWGAVE